MHCELRRMWVRWREVLECHDLSIERGPAALLFWPWTAALLAPEALIPVAV